ncbi:hypothetical protein TWF106_001367 [Orbilia oligospora]|uniref:Extragenic suppressor of kinetochore protein 1 n=1 Tax=Orbilia oligospora TaxID=2813651 RepID=A0A6G1MFN7_ORBOL|nr:hypothetical protein TWF788_007114 [Orbilia oligospora]KAF3203748.1 hypothetical protein TWF679_010101 [Orbilia oligospora]KAF3204964.1 hypothetical protein TWF106_001367 [Orbilia oligospora]KAF3207590.1 hypothetical protein TWF191_000979 [Orbilia oligospora]KAF3257085.1 hypothetical protein TWF192_001365 [Orbilia oligospora]
MFWRFGGYANISTIETLLDKPDVTLETLLEEPDLIQELKQHNTKLIEFIREDAIIRKLLEYVIAPKIPAPTVMGVPGDAKALPLTPDEVVEAAEKDAEGEKSTAEEGGNEKPVDATTAAPSDEASPSSPKEEEEQQAATAAAAAAELAPPSPSTSELEREKAEKTRAKYSYVSCEVLSSETWSICEALMDNLDNLRMFWKFLERPAPLDPLQAGYFTKVNETLFDKKTGEMMDFFKSIENIVPMMLKHIDTPLIMDLILKIISMEKSDGGSGIVDWLCEKELIPRLLSFLSPEHSSTTQTSTGDFLKAIITISANASQNEQSCIGPNNLTRQLVSEDSVESLIGAMLKGGNPLTVGVGIIIEVIRKNNSDYDPEVHGGIDSTPSGRDPIYLGNLLRLFAKHVPDFTGLILNSEPTVLNEDGTRTVKRRELKAAFGGTIEPLGFDRFKTCELMAELLHCSNMGLLNEKGSDEYVKRRDAQREQLRRQRELDLATLVVGRQDLRGSLYNRPAYLSEKKDEEEEFETVAVGTVLEEVNDGEFAEGQEKIKPSIVEDPATSPKEDKPGTEGSEPVVTELDVPTSSQPVAALSPITETAKSVEAIKIDDEDTVMQSPPPLAPLDKPETTDEKTDADKPDEHMSSPPTITATLADPASISKPEIVEPEVEKNTEKPLPPLPESAEEAASRAVKDLLLDPELLKAPGIDIDTDGRPLVGDYLKMMFVQHRVVPTILDFFFRFPWNNFLHNVVYDVVQQVFNGPMDRGFNRHLANDLFIQGSITERIVEGQKASDKAQAESNMRLGYMGHLTLIAEEVVKFAERQPGAALAPAVHEKLHDAAWVFYMEHTLTETRERDNAILGGVRPDIMSGRPGMGGSMSVTQTFGGGGLGQISGTSDTGLDTIELQNSGIGEGPDTQTAETFDGDDGDVGADIGSREGHPDESGDKSLSGFGSSSDEDEDEEMNLGDSDDDDQMKLELTGDRNQVRYLQLLLSEDVEDDIEDEEDEHGAGIGEDFEQGQSSSSATDTNTTAKATTEADLEADQTKKDKDGDDDHEMETTKRDDDDDDKKKKHEPLEP